MRLINKSVFFTLSLLASSASYAVCDVTYNFMADDRCSDIRNTKHNFAADDIVEVPGGTSGQDGRKVKALSNNEVCVYCHTPHGDHQGSPDTPRSDRPFLWNRSLPSTASYTEYSSSSLNVSAQNLGQGSRMCLSCHDGTVAIGQVDVVGGRTTSLGTGFTSDGGPLGTSPVMLVSGKIEMTGDNVAADGTLAGDDSSGYTSNLGTDLSNDHPVGFTYNTALANADGEIKDPATSSNIGVRVGGGVAHFN
ncbi:MAG: hypothetical protein R3240_06310, partial [Gammaproteobacteria bacterium]|nr:hypothetical protein [Gammaproteobacteria bacterium]